MEFELFTPLADSLPGLVWAASPDGRAEFLNRRWREYTGLKGDEALGFGWQSAIHPEDVDRLLGRWRVFLETGEPGEVQARLRRYDGEYRRFLFSAAPITDPAGRVIKWCGINTDIEDRLRAEEAAGIPTEGAPHAALKASEAELRQAYRYLTEAQRLSRTGSFTADVMTDNHIWSEELYRIFEFDPATKISVHAVRAALHPEDLPTFDTGFQRSITGGTDFDQVFRIITAGGALKYLHAFGYVKGQVEGRPVFIGAIQDVTESKGAEEALRASEAELRQAYAQLTVAQRLSMTGSFTADLLKDEHIWSDEFYRICEFEPGSQVSIQRVRDIVHPEDLQSYDAVIERGITGHDVDFQFRIITPRGTVKHLRGSARVVEFIAGRPVFMGAVQDITESKVAEEALRASERNARLIVDSIPGLVAVFTSGGELELVNRQILEYYGKTLEDLKRWETSDTVHPQDSPRAVEVFAQSIVSGAPFEVEVRARRFDGVYRWFQSRGFPLRDSNGRIVRWYNLLIDIDERKHAEEALKGSEAELRRAYGHLAEAQRLSKTGSFTADLARDEHTWSDEFYRICEFEPGSTITTQRLQSIVVPEDVPAFQGAIERAITGEDPVFDFRIVTPRGGLKHLLGVAHRLEQFPDRPVFMGAVQDVTDSRIAEESLKTNEAELKRAHSHLTEAQRLSHTGSFTWDLQADDHTWSAEIYRIFGFEPGSKVTMPRIQAAIHPDDMQMVAAVLGRAAEGADFDLVFRIITTNGAVRYAHVVGHRNEQIVDRPVFLGALQDVTEGKVAEDALNKARAELAHVTRVMTLGALTASIAHEVNQPLSGIITNASTCLRMLATDPPNLDGARATAQRTLRDGNRASEVIQRLRAMFARGQPTTEKVDLNEAAREVLTLLSSELQGSRVILRTDFDASLPAATGDRVQLQQVILNLILNAADAMRAVDDRPRVIAVATARQDGDRVRLSVRDSGVGIDPQNFEKLFEAFYTTKSHGMGVGLSISRSIIESHDGRIWASANYGPGATFSFSIPCKAESAPGLEVA